MQALWMLFRSQNADIIFVNDEGCEQLKKLVSEDYSTPEIVMYRSLIGAIFLGCMVGVRGGSFKTAYPFQHL